MTWKRTTGGRKGRDDRDPRIHKIRTSKDDPGEIDDLDPADPEDQVELQVAAELDLHTFQPKEIASVVEAYLEDAQHHGFTTVRLIHGRGIGTQREIVRSVLARSPLVVSFRDASPERGGWGATIVELGPAEENAETET
jgi:dsDNA-specific endonuclease/ATPase MutS2